MTVASEEPRLQGVAQIMVRDNLLDKDKALQFQALANTNKQTFVQYLVNFKVLPPTTIALFLSQKFGIPMLDLNAMELDSLPISLLTASLIRKNTILPLFKRGNQIFVAIEDPSKQPSLKEVQFYTGMQVNMVVVESHKLRSKIDELKAYFENQKQGEGTSNEVGALAKLTVDEVLQGIDSEVLGERDAPIVRFVNKILLEAIAKGVSDIHCETYESECRIRYRIDGVLIEVASLPAILAPRISARIKILSNLDISERRVPQDGRFNLKASKTETREFRVSVCPTTYGEKVVLRLLDPNVTRLSVDVLGLDEHQKEIFLKAIHKPQGLILVTGPTGSGKSFSLYSALNILNTKSVNICTVEDPVEIQLFGANQVNINVKAGLTFAAALRSFLRQDPDIIMVGEIRDLETAEIAVAAAQTGHLVLSTLHTNSAAETLVRLKNMGVPSYNIASSLLVLVAQRLVRKLCDACKKPVENLSFKNLLELGFSEEDAKDLILYRAEGCYQCINGYKGRIGLFEVMSITKEIEELVLAGATSIEISKKASEKGMLTIYQSGLLKVKQGLTSIEELSSVVLE